MKKTCSDYSAIPDASLSLVSFAGNAWEKIWKSVAAWNRRKITPARLAGLSPHVLRDIGIDQRHAFDPSFEPCWEV